MANISLKTVLMKSLQLSAGDYNITADMLRLLMAVDGKKSLSAIIEELGMNPATFKKALATLWDLKLVEPVKPLLDEKFFKALKRILIQLTGPMGELLVDDALDGMNLTSKIVPIERAVELINNISLGVPDPGLQDQFRNAAVKEIPKTES
jgi:DNA-binding MarR family transcriptional regulator